MAKSVLKFSEALIRGINHVNQDVVYDLPPRASKSVIAETCIDANRLSTWGHPEADEEVRALIREHGYKAVLREASKHVSQA